MAWAVAAKHPTAASSQTPQTLLDWVNCDEVDSVDWLWFQFITSDFASLNHLACGATLAQIRKPHSFSGEHVCQQHIPNQCVYKNERDCCYE
jgi:hypothetical protein